MVGAHIMLQSLAVGAGRRFPSALLGGRVEIVGKVLGVGVSNLPAAGKTGSLRRNASSVTSAISRSRSKAGGEWEGDCEEIRGRARARRAEEAWAGQDLP